MIARRLSTQPYFGPGFMRFANDVLDHPFDRVVLLVEQCGQILGIAVDAERQLR